jgi:membrane carboxypeptidase/penicillin-binding protein PbpC
VPVRKALQLSLNVPAISLLDRVGASRLSSRLKQAGANLALPKHEAPGLAMGLGGVGITLQDLVQLYSGLVRQAPHTQFPVNGSRIEMTGFGGATPRAPRTQL